jgi:hypothetical protein
MAMVQMLSPEIGKIIEKRHEMILAQEKFGVKIKNMNDKENLDDEGQAGGLDKK